MMQQQSAGWSISCQSEHQQVHRILLHEPGPELLAALLWPEASSFEAIYDSSEAINEHRNFQQYLRRQGIAVYLLGDLLAGHQSLAQHAANAIDYPNNQPSMSVIDIVSSLGIQDQIRLLVERPEVRTVRITGSGITQIQSLNLRPLSNLYFMRDQIITTDRGIILGRFKEKVRQEEQAIIIRALETLGITVDGRHQITAPGVLEGGDFIPAGKWGLLGQGLRTNDQGIQQLLDDPVAEVMGFQYIGVIKDPDPDIQEMHLDTYFMLVASDVCLVVETRINAPIGNRRDRRPTVDIYEKAAQGERYHLKQQGYPFEDFLHNELGIVNIIPLTEEDQRAYGINVLCLKDRMVVGSYSRDQDALQRQSYEQKLAAASVTLDALDFTNIRKGYGSNHCMSQALLRR